MLNPIIIYIYSTTEKKNVLKFYFCVILYHGEIILLEQKKI